MIRINLEMLHELGLPDGLPSDKVDRLLRFTYDQLQMRVGLDIAGQLSDEQLDELEPYFEAHDQDGAFAWLEVNFSDHRQVVQANYEQLLAELQLALPEIAADM